MAIVTVRDGERLSVRVLGRGQPVLMLHGLGMKSSHWLPFILPHIGRFRFYMPDFRGGAGESGSAHLNQADVFQNHMEDVEDIVRHFRLWNFRLVGYSLGASTSLHWQRAGGFERVRRYLHIDQSPCVGNREGWQYGLFGGRQAEFHSFLRRLLRVLEPYSGQRELRELPLSARQAVLTALADILVHVGGRDGVRQVLRLSAHWPQMLGWLGSMSRLSDIRAYAAAYLRAEHDYRPSLEGCTTPFTLFVGMRSPLYNPAGQLAMAHLVKHCRVVRFEQSGHVPLTDEPLKFGREFGHFLREP